MMRHIYPECGIKYAHRVGAAVTPPHRIEPIDILNVLRLGPCTVHRDGLPPLVLVPDYLTGSRIVFSIKVHLKAGGKIIKRIAPTTEAITEVLR